MASENDDGKLQKGPVQGVRKHSINLIANPYFEWIDKMIQWKHITGKDDKKRNNKAQIALINSMGICDMRKVDARIREASVRGRAWDTMKKPRLLALPAEIRLMIYDIILATRDIIVIEATGQTESDGKNRPKTPAYGQLVGLLLTCEQISHELRDYIWMRTPEHVGIYDSFGPVNLEAQPYFIVRFPWNLDGDVFSSDEDYVYVDRGLPEEGTEWNDPWDFYKAQDRMIQLTINHNGTVGSYENEFFIFEAKTGRDLMRMWVWKQVMQPHMSRREFNTQVKRFVKKDSRAKSLLKELETHKQRCFGYRFRIGHGWQYWYQHWRRGFGTLYGGRVANPRPRGDQAGQWDESDICRLFEVEAR